MGTWMVIGYTIVVSQIIGLLLAVPAYFLLRRYWRVGFLQCVVSGAAIAALINLVGLIVWSNINEGYSAADGWGDTIVNGQYTTHGWVMLALGFVGTMLFGTAIGFFFWAIAIWSSQRNAHRAQ